MPPLSTRISLYSRQTSFLAFCLVFAFFLLAGFSAYSQTGLVAHYAFNGVFSDQTSNGNHAIATGNPAFTTDRNGQANRAISFGGCTNPQFLRVPNSASLQVTEAMTVALWAKVDLSSGMDPGDGTCTANGRQVFFAKAGDGYGVSPPGFLGLTYQQGGQQGVTFEANAGQVNAVTTREQPGATWHHYAYVLTTTEVKLYIDAQLVLTSPSSLTFAEANQQDLYLGVMGPKSSPVLGITHWYPLNGALDDVKIFNRRLDATEVSTVYASDDVGSCAPTAATILPSGNALFCDGEPLTLKATSIAPEVQLQWQRDGQPIAQATLDSLVVSQAGTYRIETTKRQDAWKSDFGQFNTTMNAVHFVNSNVGWIVGEGGLLLKTTDGNNWNTIPTNRIDNLKSISFVNTQIGWMAGVSGLLLKSFDGGLTWARQFIPITGDILKIQFLNENIGYALGDSLLFKTIDGGVSWLTVNIVSANELTDISFTSINSGWISTKNQIFRTIDGGNSWSLLRTINTNMGSFISDIYSLDSNKCWFTYNSYGGNFETYQTNILMTSDGGMNWNSSEISNSSMSYMIVNELSFVDSQNGYLLGRYYAGLYPTRNSVLHQTSGRILKTLDGGLTWKAVYQNDFSALPVALAIRSEDRGTMVGKGGLMVNLFIRNGEIDNTYSRNENRTFEDIHSIAVSPLGFGEAVGGSLALTLTPGLDPHPKVMIHPNSSKVFLKSSGQQNNWIKQEEKSGKTLYQIQYKKDNALGWRVGYETLQSTTNGGVSWEDIIPDLGNITITKAYLQNTGNGFFITGTRAVVYSNDFSSYLYKFNNDQLVNANAPSYKGPNDPYDTGMLDLQFINDNTGFITTTNGKLIKTSDGGNSWSVQLVRANTALTRVFFVTAQMGWVIGKNGLVLKTINGGSTWTEQTAGTTVDLNGIHFLSTQEGYVVGGNGTMLKTANGGTTWVRIETNTRNALNDITFTTRDKGYAVGESGTILSFNPTLLPDCKTVSAAVNVSQNPGAVCESTGSGSWNNAITWTCGHVPLSCDQVVVSHVVTLSQSVQVRSVEIRQNGQLAVQGGDVRLENQP